MRQKNNFYTGQSFWSSADIYIYNISNLKITVFPSFIIDHCPLRMQFNDNVINQKRRPFIYADFWQYIDGYNDVIDFSSVPISLGTNMYQFVMFVKVMRNRLKDWNKKRPKHDDEIHKI